MKRMLLVFLAAATPAIAGPREDMLAGVERCRALSSDRVFLDCVYGAAQPLRASLGLAPASLAQQQLVPPLSAMRPPLPARAPASQPAAPRMTSGQPVRDWLETYSFDRRGLFTVMLGNGQMLRQDPSDPARADGRGRASDYRVMLVMHSARTGELSVQGDRSPYRVLKVE